MRHDMELYESNAGDLYFVVDDQYLDMTECAEDFATDCRLIDYWGEHFRWLDWDYADEDALDPNAPQLVAIYDAEKDEARTTGNRPGIAASRYLGIDEEAWEAFTPLPTREAGYTPAQYAAGARVEDVVL